MSFVIAPKGLLCRGVRKSMLVSLWLAGSVAGSVAGMSRNRTQVDLDLPVSGPLSDHLRAYCELTRPKIMRFSEIKQSETANEPPASIL